MTWQRHELNRACRAVWQETARKNLTALVDGPRRVDMDRRRRVDQRVEIDHRLAFLGMERDFIECPRAIIRVADDLTRSVYAERLALAAGRNRAKIGHVALFPEECMAQERRVRHPGTSDHLRLVIERGRIRFTSPKRAEVDHVSVRPQKRVLYAVACHERGAGDLAGIVQDSGRT